MTIDWKQRADELLEEFNLCCKARPKHDAINIQLEKDKVSKFAVNLNNQRGWGTDNEIAEACYQLEPRLARLKEMLVMEILTNGSV
jgi:predicted glycosyltransferase involved in capsule biosynthesis